LNALYNLSDGMTFPFPAFPIPEMPQDDQERTQDHSPNKGTVRNNQQAIFHSTSKRKVILLHTNQRKKQGTNLKP
jgi:hypothetical protein